MLCPSAVVKNFSNPTSIPVAVLISSLGKESGTVLSSKEKLTYQPSALEIIVACLISKPSGIGRCKITSISLILDSLRILSVRCAPPLGELTRGKVNELISPRFLNRGFPPFFPNLSLWREYPGGLDGRVAGRE
ncbi:hypothetical protein LC608_20570 [Nostoc sp. XA010]|nr:hypothetical protein [Nostoc sp. XA010]